MSAFGGAKFTRKSEWIKCGKIQSRAKKICLLIIIYLDKLFIGLWSVDMQHSSFSTFSGLPRWTKGKHRSWRPSSSKMCHASRVQENPARNRAQSNTHDNKLKGVAAASRCPAQGCGCVPNSMAMHLIQDFLTKHRTFRAVFFEMISLQNAS